MLDGNTSNLEDMVWNLTSAEIEVLYWVCQGEINENISEKRNRSINTVKSQLSSVYTKLNVPDKLTDDLKRQYLMAMFCDVVRQIVLDEASLETFGARKRARRISNQRQEVVHEGVLRRVLNRLDRLSRRTVSDGQRQVFEGPPEARIRWFIWIALGLIGVVVIGIVIVQIIRIIDPADDGLFVPSTANTVVSFDVTTQPFESAEVNVLESTNTVEVLPIPSNTLVPPTSPDDVTITQPSALLPPSPTNSLIQTPLVLVDTATPISIDFEDNFSDGLADGWESLSGDPLILNQSILTPRDDELFIAYGDQNWTDYQVEVGVESAACGIRGNYIAVRLTDFSMVAFVFSGCGGSFYEYDGEWRRIDSTIYNKGSLQGTTVKVVVEGNEITGYIKGVAVASITTGFPNGRVGLKIQKDSAISFFKVSIIK